MAILLAPPRGWKRPSITLGTEVLALRRLLRDLGYPRIHLDHRPPLSERQFDTESDDTIPPANHPDYIEALTPKEHDKRTNGPGGEKRITTAGSDSNRRAKTRALTKQQEEFRRRLLAKDAGEPRPRPERRGAPLRSRGFDTTKTKGFDGVVRERKKRRRS